MKDEDRQAVEDILENSAGQIGFAYLYPNDGSERKEFFFDMTPENIANFIGAHQYDAEKIILTDVCDRLVLETAGGFLDRCPNQELCRKIIPILAPIQMGEAEAKEISIVTREDYEAYGRYEDELATEAEYGMMF